MSLRVRGSLLLSVLLVCPVLLAQQGSSPETGSETPVIRSTRREVLIDLVVRDKHHHVVTDVRPEDVVVYEDGVAQKINVFRNVAGAEQLASEKNAASIPKLPELNSGNLQGPVTSLHHINFVAVVFADVAPLNIPFAREAVLEFLKSDNLPNTYVSVYRLRRTLKVVQLYTENKDLLVKAVDSAAKGTHTDAALDVNAKVVSGAFSSLQALANNILSSPNVDLTTANAVRNAELYPFASIVRDPNFARDASAQDVSVTLGNAILSEARVENGIRFASSLSNGMDAIDSLREIVRSQEMLPGRKVVLYLSDGLEFPMNRRDAVDNLISYANRSGVAFYAVDTRGLNVEDPMMQSLAELERTGALSRSQKSDPHNAHKEDDDIQLTAVSNKQLPLRELAESTGGFAVTDTNEIALPMQRVMEDIRSHYELAYTPSSADFDGHFRKIIIKVNRPHVSDLHYRKGYFALPDINGEPLQPFEAVALHAINARPASAPFPYRIAVMRFRPGQDAVEHEVTLEVPLSALHRESDPQTGRPRVKASVVALIYNANGEVIGKIGRELVREMRDPIASQLANDYILYSEPVELHPGHYVIDAAVTDELSAQTSVKRLAFFVSPSKDFGLSSLELVKERQNAVAKPESLAVTGNILPTLSESVRSGSPVSLYFVLYPSRLDSGEDPKVVLQVLRDGKEVARQRVKLPQPGPDGSVPIMLRLSPERGQCDIFVTAQQGRVIAQSSLSVRVE